MQRLTRCKVRGFYEAAYALGEFQMQDTNTDSTSALADLVGVMLQHNLDASIYDQFVKVGQGAKYTKALKNAIVVLGTEGALMGVEQRLGVKLPPDTLARLSTELSESDAAAKE